MPKRWYDTDATMSLAISMLKNASSETQDAICELMSSKFEEMNIDMSDKFILFKVFDKRWYDEKENLYNLLETIRCCSTQDRKTIALCIIDNLCTLVKA